MGFRLTRNKRISTFHQAMNRVHALGLPAHIKARIVNFFFNVGLYHGGEVGGFALYHGGEVGGFAVQGMTDLPSNARRALGKGANASFCPFGAHGPWGLNRRSAGLR
eukprot:1788490-Amphidinium_carterae.2